jgi:hypothetical protein
MIRRHRGFGAGPDPDARSPNATSMTGGRRSADLFSALSAGGNAALAGAMTTHANGRLPISTSAARRAGRRQANNCCGDRQRRRVTWLGAGGKRSAGGLAHVDRTVVDHDDDRLDRQARPRAIKAVEPLQEGNEIGAALGFACVHDEAASGIECSHDRHRIGLAGHRHAQVGAAGAATKSADVLQNLELKKRFHQFLRGNAKPLDRSVDGGPGWPFGRAGEGKQPFQYAPT